MNNHLSFRHLQAILPVTSKLNGYSFSSYWLCVNEQHERQ